LKYRGDNLIYLYLVLGREKATSTDEGKRTWDAEETYNGTDVFYLADAGVAEIRNPALLRHEPSGAFNVQNTADLLILAPISISIISNLDPLSIDAKEAFVCL
jgi:hypothetical protein